MRNHVTIAVFNLDGLASGVVEDHANAIDDVSNFLLIRCCHQAFDQFVAPGFGKFNQLHLLASACIVVGAAGLREVVIVYPVR